MALARAIGIKPVTPRAMGVKSFRGTHTPAHAIWAVGEARRPHRTVVFEAEASSVVHAHAVSPRAGGRARTVPDAPPHRPRGSGRPAEVGPPLPCL